jgi:hypothetical protein
MTEWSYEVARAHSYPKGQAKTQRQGVARINQRSIFHVYVSVRESIHDTVYESFVKPAFPGFSQSALTEKLHRLFVLYLLRYRSVLKLKIFNLE